MSELQVSVVIPVYNGEQYLGESIESVLEQDYDEVEVIVVDDGSTDSSAEIAERFEGIRLIRQKNAGPGAALNAGIRHARGELVAFLDADDLWERGMLASRVAMFAADPSLEMTHGMVSEFLSPDTGLSVAGSGRGIDKPIRARLCGTTMIRREALLRVGLIDTELTLGSWSDWVMRAQEAGLRTEYQDGLVLRRRIHGDNLSIREAGSRADYVRMLKRALDRRRGTTK